MAQLLSTCSPFWKMILTSGDRGILPMWPLWRLCQLWALPREFPSITTAHRIPFLLHLPDFMSSWDSAGDSSEPESSPETGKNQSPRCMLQYKTFILHYLKRQIIFALWFQPVSPQRIPGKSLGLKFCSECGKLEACFYYTHTHTHTHTHTTWSYNSRIKNT